MKSTEVFGHCDDTDCDNAAYYLVKDREEGKSIRVCGVHLGVVRGDKK